MAKRNRKKKQHATSAATPSETSAVERQVLAFAEQLGYVAGSIESRTEGLDRQKLSRQITGVQKGAKRLMDKLASGVASRVQRTPVPKRPIRKARSGGTVDAPGRARAAGHRPRQG